MSLEGAAQSVPVETQVASAKPEEQSQMQIATIRTKLADQSAKASSSVADSATSRTEGQFAVASALASNAEKLYFIMRGQRLRQPRREFPSGD